MDALSERKRPAYTTVQTMVNRLEAKGVLRRTAKTGKSEFTQTVTSPDGAKKKTSSGKLQRAKCRELYLEEQLELA
mgnify:CR=1 FL=1